MTDPAQACLTVDLDALAANFRTIAKLARGAETAPVVKADAYGLGMAPVALRLWREGARSFFVARVGEGERLRDVFGPRREAEIYVLDGCPAGAAARLTQSRLVPVLGSLPEIEEWGALARRLGRVLDTALHVDTGMNRLGLRLEEAEALALAPDRLAGIETKLLISHLACADEREHPLNRMQLERFRRAARLFPNAARSLANSAGVRLGDEYLFAMVRPGIALYGGGPQDADGPIRPVATFEAPILQVRTVPPGESIGYGATYTADRPMRVAIVAGGYADGVLRAQSPAGYGWLDGAPRRLLGRISMDLTAFDVTGCDAARPGARIELLGPNVALEDAARAAGTISYELLVRLGDRAERRYLGQVE